MRFDGRAVLVQRSEGERRYSEGAEVALYGLFVSEVLERGGEEKPLDDYTSRLIFRFAEVLTWAGAASGAPTTETLFRAYASRHRSGYCEILT